MILNKIEYPQKDMIVGKTYLYKAFGQWMVGVCDTPFKRNDLKCVCNIIYASLDASDSCVSDIYELPSHEE